MADRWHERVGDAVVGLFSPRSAALRRHWRRVDRDPSYRAAYETALNLRGYKSASHAKGSTPWLNASNRSADGEILGDLATLRNRSRAANRDDALASGINRTFVRGVVGTGLRPQSKAEPKAKADACEKVWYSRADRLALADGKLPHGSHQQLVYGKRREDGDVFLTAAVDGSTLWIETVEGDRVCTPCDAVPADPAGRIVEGVEKDAFGRVVAYWILRQHPGEVVTQATKLGPKAEGWVSPWPSSSFVRVPEARVCHDRSRVTRPGQTRGVPDCHAILQDLRDLDLLMLASLKRAQIAACLAVFLTSSADASDLIELTAEDYGYSLDQKLEPGMVFRLFPGESIETAQPSATLPDIETLVLILARRIGAAVGLSPQAVLRWWDGVNYSGARTIKIDDRTTYRAERASFAETSLTWEWRTVLEHELMLGNPDLLAADVTLEDVQGVEWIGDEEQWVDPLAEADAIETMLRLGLTTLKIEAERLGRNWEELLAQKAAEKKLIESLGLTDPLAEPQVKRPTVQEMPAAAPAKKGVAA